MYRALAVALNASIAHAEVRQKFTWPSCFRRLRWLHRDGHMPVHPPRERSLNGVAPGGVHP